MPDLSPEQAFELVKERFPIADYIVGDVPRGYLNIAQTALKYVPRGGTILDFGSGPCDKAAILQAMGYRCTAYDDLDDPWHKQHGNRERILDFIRQSGIDFRTDRNTDFGKEQFDMVMLLHVLEHFHDSPRDLLNNLLESAKPRGLLFLMMPNITNIRKRIGLLLGKTNLESFGRYYWTPGSWRGHVREYSRGDLEQLATFLNLEVLQLGGVHDMLGRLPALVRPVYMTATALFPGWRDSWMLVARKPEGWKPIREAPMHYEHFAQSKDWVPKQSAS